MNIKFNKLHESAVLPKYASKGAAGADIYACIPEEQVMYIQPKQHILVPTKLKIELPEGYEAQIRPRSGLSLHYGITILNSPGTIDADYRGEIGVILYNSGIDVFIVAHLDRIAQMVIAPVQQYSFIEVSEIDSTERGDGGFGSTGKN